MVTYVAYSYLGCYVVCCMPHLRKVFPLRCEVDMASAVCSLRDAFLRSLLINDPLVGYMLRQYY